MARISKLVVSESVSELKGLLKKQTKHKNMDRLRMLIYLLEGSFSTREELSTHLDVSRRTIERWIEQYCKGGVDNLLLPEKRYRKSHIIPEEVNKGLEQRLNNSELGFSSYVEAKNWIAAEYNLELKYNTVREHLIRYFKTKIKSPRKSHVKKDKEAVDAFLKTT